MNCKLEENSRPQRTAVVWSTCIANDVTIERTAATMIRPNLYKEWGAVEFKV